MKVRYEYIAKKRESGATWETSQAYPGEEYPDCEVIFYSEADGKHYGYIHIGCREYSDSDIVECYEVEKKEVVTTVWERVR